MNNSDDAAKALIINPYYVVTFADYLFEQTQRPLTKEDWVAANTILIENDAVELWLDEFLKVISSPKSDETLGRTHNPYHAIMLSSDLAGEHDVVLLKDDWVANNMKFMKELGVGAWLWLLLTTLETK